MLGKNLKNAALALMISGATGTVVGMELLELMQQVKPADLAKFGENLNVQDLLALVKGLADQVTISDDVAATLASMERVATANMYTIPSKILGLDLEQFKAGALSQAAITDVQQKLPIMITFLKNPDLAISVFTALVLPELEKSLKVVEGGKAVLAPVKAFLNFAKETPAIKDIARSFADILLKVQPKLSQPQEFIAAYQAAYNEALPIIRNAIASNASALIPILKDFKKIQLTPAIIGALIKTQSKVKETVEEIVGMFGGG